ncbi:hypothetical protein BJY00DRAFT_296949 [Aspergillus carlsbadensis]|nr:hypothetical protein BJY00DRAFT_296949 [Aspergillus carlsbadensis]
MIWRWRWRWTWTWIRTWLVVERERGLGWHHRAGSSHRMRIRRMRIKKSETRMSICSSMMTSTFSHQTATILPPPEWSPMSI